MYVQREATHVMFYCILSFSFVQYNIYGCRSSKGKDTGNDYIIQDIDRNSVQFEIQNNGNMNLMAGGGNVGIGTTSPLTKLHLSSNDISGFKKILFAMIDNEGKNIFNKLNE